MVISGVVQVVSRQRNFTFIVYPDSAPADWVQILDDLHVQTFISPLHDQDINPTGEVKKAHWHVLLMFEGKKTLEQVQKISDSISGVKVQPCLSLRGMARYLCHFDNPDKHQYSSIDVVQLGGSDYLKVCDLQVNRYEIIKEILCYVRDQNIKSYHVLLEYAMEYEYEWFRILCDSATYVVKEYISSRYDSIKSQD